MLIFENTGRHRVRKRFRVDNFSKHGNLTNYPSMFQLYPNYGVF